MFCESCGSFIPDGQSFCTNCGAPAPQPIAQPAAQPVAAQPIAAQPVAQPVQPVQPVAQPVQPVYQQPIAQPVQPIYQQPVYAQPVNAAPIPVKRSNGAATAGLVFGILTFVFCWVPFLNVFTTAVLGLLGLIFSIVGLTKKNVGGKGKAIAGLILALLGTIGTILFYAYLAKSVSESPEWEEFYSEFSEAMEDIDSSSFDYDYDYDDNDVDGIIANEFSINGDFANTERGYISGVLHIDGYIVDF